ncbi:hypothetical protein SEUCBS139899_010644 [Sporothrix eucalyptigena]|uniref:FAD-binding domain-containing protein n=1 Tax=Sporothrix eucalyptigena TaxID=1812306 RepID=A0ABP0BHB9_9PEZI
MAPGFSKILIVGAGPAGQLLGLLLAKENIDVTILDQADKLDENPRATHYAPPAMRVLNFAGVGDKMREKGFAPGNVAWRKLDGTFIAGMDNESQKDSLERMIALPLDQLGRVLYDHSKKFLSIKYLFNHKVTSIGHNEKTAWVNVEITGSGKETRFEADYIVGCDGANSIIRRSLFGDWEFPGRTWDEQIVATNVYYPFEKFHYSDSNFIIDPVHWHMAAKITKDGMWRVTYGDLPGLTRDELIARQPEKFKTILPGHPDPSGYKLVNISPYKVHQRLAKSLRVGRFLLAADAAHLCNPFGGLGLTGGIVDVGGLYQCLKGIYTKVADESILDIYSDIRRKRYLEMVDTISSANLRRMFTVPPDEVLEKDNFLKLCKQSETDKELAQKMAEGAHALSYDFTQHYKTA